MTAGKQDASPFLGKTVLITRDNSSSSAGMNILLDAGATIRFFPAIKLSMMPIGDSIASKLTDGFFHRIVFTSVNTVHYFLAQIQREQVLHGNKKPLIAAVGIKTAHALNTSLIIPDTVPVTQNAAGLAEMLANEGVEGENILLPSSDIARDELADALMERGAAVFRVPVYKNECPARAEVEAEIREEQKKKSDAYLFTSPSAFHNFAALLYIKNVEEYFNGAAVAAIGKTTAEHIRAAGCGNILVPHEPSIERLAETVYNYFSTLVTK